MRSHETKTLRVGVLLLITLAVLAGGFLILGEDQNLFRSKNHYRLRLPSTEGLQTGNPVQLSGVRVGGVGSIRLPEDPAETLLEVTIAVDSRYGPRIREDSRAQVRTLGLLGDKYIDLSTGSPNEPQIPDGGEIRAAETTGVEELMASGEDVAEHVVSISRSLSIILDRIEQGEGVLGDLLSAQAAGDRSATKELFEVLDSTQNVVARIESGEGSLGRLLVEDTLAVELETSLGRLNRLLEQAESGDGLLPALLSDVAMKESVSDTLTRLNSTADRMDRLAGDLSAGKGLLPRLIHDEEYGDAALEELRQLLERFNAVAGELTEGDGTAARLIHDPSIYQALNDIVVGINDSKILRWLLRNRQRAGIRHRLSEEGQEPEEGGDG